MADWEEEGGGHQKVYGEDGTSTTRVLLTDATGKLEVNATVASAAPLTSVAHTQVDVNTDTAVLAANADRVWALIINDSDTVIYLNLGGAGVANEGIRLNANGGAFETAGTLGNLWTGTINANHGGGAVNKSLIITEGE